MVWRSRGVGSSGSAWHAARVVWGARRAKVLSWNASCWPEAEGAGGPVEHVGLGVPWEEDKVGGELRLGGHDGDVKAIVACYRRICSGSDDGSIRVWTQLLWRRATGEHEPTLQANEVDEEEEEKEILNSLNNGWGM